MNAHTTLTPEVAIDLSAIMRAEKIGTIHYNWHLDRFIRNASLLIAVISGVCLVLIVAGAVRDGRSPSGPGSISLRSTETLRVSSAHAVTIPIAKRKTQ